MVYATFEDVASRSTRTFSESEENVINVLLRDAAEVIDSFNEYAEYAKKQIVSCNMIIRALGDGQMQMPIGSTQGTMSALGYSQTWTMGSGSTGELYLSRIDKKLLGYSGRIGASNPFADLC